MGRQWRERNKPADLKKSKPIEPEEKIGHAIEEEPFEGTGDFESDVLGKKPELENSAPKENSWAESMEHVFKHPFAPIGILLCVAMTLFKDSQGGQQASPAPEAPAQSASGG